MAPVVLACQAHPRIEPLVCFTGQHDEMLRQVTDYFGIQPDLDFALMRPGQSLGQLTARCVAALDEVLPWVEQWHPDVDPGLGQPLAAFYRGQLDQVLTSIGATIDDARAWAPPAPTRGRKAGAKKKAEA